MVGGTFKSGDVGRLVTETSGATTDLVTVFKADGTFVNKTVANASKSIGLAATEVAYADSTTAIVGDLTKMSYDDTSAFAVGSSGVAGTVSSFPGTATSGSLRLTAVDSSSDVLVTISNADHAQASVYSIPDGGQSTANVLISEGAQTIAGVQTYTAPQVIDSNTGITAFATGGQGSATALTGEYNNVTTCATAADSVLLLTAVAGQVQTVKNSGAAVCAVFPNTSDSINALAANLSIDVAPNSSVTFRAIDGTVWETQERLTLPSPTTQTGNIIIQAAANDTNVDLTITNAAMAGARVVTVQDPNSATSNLKTVQTVVVTLTSAEILALNATAIQVIAAPGLSGFVTVIEDVWVSKAAGTAYANIAAGDDIVLKYTNSSGSIATESIEMTGFADSTSATQAFAHGVSCLPVDNAAIVAHMLTGEIDTGDSDFILKINFRFEIFPAAL